MRNITRFPPALVAVVLCLAAAFVPMGTAHGQQLPLNMAPVLLDVPLIQQETPMWCWIAVADMVIQHESHVRYEQCEMLDAAAEFPQGTCCARPYECMLGASSRYIQELMWTFGGVQSHEITRPLAFSELRELLDEGRPVIAQVKMVAAPFGHVIVVVGAGFHVENVWTPAGLTTIATPLVVVNDPQVPEPVTMTYGALRNVWFGTIITDGRVLPDR